MQIKTNIISCHTADSKPVKQEVNSTLILTHLIFPGTLNQHATPDLVECLLDALLGSGDGDCVAVLAALRDGDLGGGPLLQVLQLGAALAQDEAMVVLGDVDVHDGLGLEKEVIFLAVATFKE